MKIDRESQKPLYMQIRDGLRAEIDAGELAAGTRLATVAAMAADYEVTPATIRRAIQDLVSEGLVTAHVGRGTFVAGGGRLAETLADIRSSYGPQTATGSAAAGFSAAAASPALAAPTRNGERDNPSRNASAARAANRLRQSVARGLNELVNAAMRPGVIAFTRGTGDPDTIAEGTLTRLVQAALAGGERVFLDYGDPRGLPALRESIAALYAKRGLEVSADQVLVTSGSQQALALIAQAAAESSSPVILETPCYSGVTNAFAAFANPIETLVRGEDGPAISALPASLDTEGAVFYYCPYLHNPTGTNISGEKQSALASWARRRHALLVADEVFRDLCFPDDEALPPSILAEAGSERSALVASLSKSFISGLRVGWLVSSAERIDALATLKKAMDLSCPPLMQGIARAFLDEEEGYAAHRQRAREHYRLRRDALLAALEEYMPDCITWTVPDGGFQLQVSLPRGYSSVELLLRASERGVAFLPGPLQDLNKRFVNTLRLCYGSLSPDEIAEGIRRLALACEEYLYDSGRDSGLAGLGDY